MNKLYEPFTVDTISDMMNAFRFSLKSSCNDRDVFKDSYIPDAKNPSVRFIKDIKQNGPATIIFPRCGKKVVAKCQDGKPDPYLGFLMCLLKYLLPSKVYSDCVSYIFFCADPYAGNTSGMRVLAEAMVLSHIGEDDYNKLYSKFFSEED